MSNFLVNYGKFVESLTTIEWGVGSIVMLAIVMGIFIACISVFEWDTRRNEEPIAIFTILLVIASVFWTYTWFVAIGVIILLITFLISKVLLRGLKPLLED